MCEDHLYFAMLDLRWTDTANFRNGLGKHMFGPIPALVRPIVKSLLRRMNAKRLHGLGRHGRSDITAFATRDVEALAAILGDRPYLMGDEPCGADAFVFGIVTSILTPPLDSALRTAMLRHANLVAYRDRVSEKYFARRPALRAAPATRPTSQLLRGTDHA